jgi:hypothetical protein
MTEEQLTALLRLKRYEQPPPDYFDRLLQDIQRRQREDLVQWPLWKIAMERVQTFFSEHSVGHLSAAGTLAVALLVGAVVIWLIPASTEPPRKAAAATPQPILADRQTRYVIDARPVSYELSSSISF